MHYIAVFHPVQEKEGAYVVTFPDLPGCVTQGDSFLAAFNMAQEALDGFLDVLRQDGEPIPKASYYNEAMKKAHAECEETGEALHPQAKFQPVPTHWMDQVTPYSD